MTPCADSASAISAAGFAVERLSSEDPETVRLAARVLGTLSAADLLHPDDRELVRAAFAEGLPIDARESRGPRRGGSRG